MSTYYHVCKDYNNSDIESLYQQFGFDYYFKHQEGEKKYSEHGYGEVASQEDIKKWYESKGWYIRPKTW